MLASTHSSSLIGHKVLRISVRVRTRAVVDHRGEGPDGAAVIDKAFGRHVSCSDDRAYVRRRGHVPEELCYHSVAQGVLVEMVEGIIFVEQQTDGPSCGRVFGQSSRRPAAATADQTRAAVSGPADPYVLSRAPPELIGEPRTSSMVRVDAHLRQGPARTRGGAG